MISKMLAALGAASLLIASGTASARTAAPLSLERSPLVRTGANLEDANEIRGSAKWILGAIALGLLIWGAIELFGDNDEAFPTSP